MGKEKDGEEEEGEGMTTASSRIRGLHAVTRQLPRVKRVKTETWVCLIYKVFEKTEYIWSEEGLTED